MKIRKKVFLVFFLLVLFVILLNLHNNLTAPQYGLPAAVDGILAGLYSPPLKILDRAGNFLSGTWNNYFFLISVNSANQKLKEEVRMKDLYILSLRERLKSGRRFDGMIEGIKSTGFGGVPARVIAYDPNTQSQTMWLSAGSASGIKVDDPVMTLKGLAGRIIKVFPAVSQVLLLVDPHFSVDVINEETRVRALVTGSGRSAVLERYPLLSHLEFLKLGDEMNAGDLLITSGLAGIYPAGIPVGNIIRPEDENESVPFAVQVLPCADFSKLEEVIVLSGQARGAMDKK